MVVNTVNTRANDVDCRQQLQHDDVEVIDERQRYYLVVQEILN